MGAYRLIGRHVVLFVASLIVLVGLAVVAFPAYAADENPSSVEDHLTVLSSLDDGVAGADAAGDVAVDSVDAVGTIGTGELDGAAGIEDAHAGGSAGGDASNADSGGAPLTENNPSYRSPSDDFSVGALTTLAAGWVLEGGGWRYYENGLPAEGFKTIVTATDEGDERQTYYFGSDGYRKSGWLRLDGLWYFFDDSTQAQESGSSMWTGWLYWDYCWFYLDSQGRMLTGWQKIDGLWYLFQGGDSGRMRQGWLEQSGVWYYLQPDESGKAAMLTGLHRLPWARGESWFYFYGGDDGRMAEGWQKFQDGDDGDGEFHWYYFSPGRGDAVLGWLYWGDSWFYLDASRKGQMLTGLHRLTWTRGESWFYFYGGDNGRMAEGWQKLDRDGEADWYFFNHGNGDMRHGWLKSGFYWYYLSDESGKMLTGWQSLTYTGGTGTFCFHDRDSGRMMTGWADYEGTWRFLDDEGLWRGEAFDQKMRTIQDGVGTGGDVLYRSFNYVVSFGYRSGDTYPTGHWAPDYAMEMYDRGSGNCYRFAALFCMLALANGYDARVVSGAVPSLSRGWAPHAWVEIYYNGSYYVCDPDMAHEAPGHSWYWVTYGSAPITYRW